MQPTNTASGSVRRPATFTGCRRRPSGSTPRAPAPPPRTSGATLRYPHVARGGSWDDDDLTKLRCAARRASGPAWKIQDPQLPKSVWYHTDAQFLGFRIVRPLKVPTPEEAQAYW